MQILRTLRRWLRLDNNENTIEIKPPNLNDPYTALPMGDRYALYLNRAIRENDLNFQKEVRKWMDATFPPYIVENPVERGLRVTEEALELAQSVGVTSEQAHRIVDHVWGRAIGQTRQEIGGLMVCIAALCEATKHEFDEAMWYELIRCWRYRDRIIQKQAVKLTQGIAISEEDHDTRDD